MIGWEGDCLSAISIANSQFGKPCCNRPLWNYNRQPIYFPFPFSLLFARLTHGSGGKIDRIERGMPKAQSQKPYFHPDSQSNMSPSIGVRYVSVRVTESTTTEGKEGVQFADQLYLKFRLLNSSNYVVTICHRFFHCTLLQTISETNHTGDGWGDRADARKHLLWCADQYLHVSPSVRYFGTA